MSHRRWVAWRAMVSDPRVPAGSPPAAADGPSAGTRIAGAALLGLVGLGLVLAQHAATAQASPSPDAMPIPVLAYYYIWFETTSWDRAKIDYPLLGRYTSDDRSVMEQHVKWAKEAGIDGFIVSWKSSENNDRRLEQLISVASEHDFKLSIIYQGLDFERRPLAPERIADDLDLFIERYADNPVFRIFEKPVVIWSGTWAFTPEEIAGVTQTRREQLLILASEKNPEDYGRLAAFTDGDAYYWSSVNPETFLTYQEKLNSFSTVIHEHGGLWIAPAAPGFDAREVGGERTVERKEGATLMREMDVATKSSPDAIGVISWNEFSENTHLEPSQQHGYRYLTVLAHILDAKPPTAIDFDSSEPGEGRDGLGRAQAPLILGGLAILLLLGLTIIARRSRGEAQEPPEAPSSE